MHIPDGYLSPATQLAGFAVMTPVWFRSARKTRASLTSRQVPLLSISAAFCFAVMMFNIPAPGGTTAHALGAVLAAILLGPDAAIMAMTFTLVVQALFFGDGGILSLGVNCLNMGFVSCVAGYWCHRLVAGSSAPGSSRWLTAGATAAFVGISAAALSTALTLGLQPLIAHDAAGHALYFPFGWSVAVPAMMAIHLLVAAPAEAIVTAAALAYCARNFPEYLGREPARRGKFWRPARALGLVVAFTPLGLIASGCAWGEWDLPSLERMVGYAPSGLASTHALTTGLDGYAIPGLSGRGWEIAGYVACAFLGAAAVALFLRLLIVHRAPIAVAQTRSAGPGSTLPSWMLEANPPGRSTSRSGRWLERSVAKIRDAAATAVSRERSSKQNGFLQRIDPRAKTLAFIAVSITIGFLTNAAVLVGLGISGLLLAASSHLNLASLLVRIAGLTAFFGVPPLLVSVAMGQHSSPMLILRLAGGLLFAALWTSTTEWRDLLKALRALRAPEFCIRGVSLTFRFLFVLLDTLAEMLVARKSRQAGGLSRSQARLYAGAGAAVLFGKSATLTEEVHMAMRSRGSDIFKPVEPAHSHRHSEPEHAL